MSTASDDPALAPGLADTLRLGPAHLTVSHLDGSIAFYQRALGLRLHDRNGEVAAMGAGGEDLLVLVEDADAALGGRHAGLFHFALLLASRTELARAVLRLASTQTRIEGSADHGVSEAIYLRDPDDNGIELYADRPREQWPPARHPDERVEIFTVALNMKDLMREVEDEEPREHAGEGVVMGRLHLHVGDVERGLAFYRDVLGFEIMVRLPSAAFVSAGGYHHHLGFNVWLGPDVNPPPPHTAGLRHWTVQLKSPDEVTAVRARVDETGLETLDHGTGFLVRDPWETAVVFSVG
ncbi:catechol 2,3-dioxygenase [soil metagenome]|jgi:catechol 2,3-dioxygenase